MQTLDPSQRQNGRAAEAARPGPTAAGRVISAAAILGAAVAAAYVGYLYYAAPRSYDANIRANSIELAPHVSGWVTELPIVDNQRVKKGDLLFRVDDRPYRATLMEKQADLEYSRQYLQRIQGLLAQHFVKENDVVRARDQFQADEAAVDLAQLDVDYCEVRAPFDGYVTNLNISLHEYASAGRPVMALIDDGTWYVLANYREQFLRFIQPGMPATVYVESYPNAPFRGRVEGISWGVQTENAGQAATLLPQVEPNLDWVTLAQRFPVRIVLETRPGRPLRIGETAVVTIDGRP